MLNIWDTVIIKSDPDKNEFFVQEQLHAGSIPGYKLTPVERFLNAAAKKLAANPWYEDDLELIDTYVYRITYADGRPFIPEFGKVKGLYYTQRSAKLAKQHVAGDAKVQRGKVEWGDYV